MSKLRLKCYVEEIVEIDLTSCGYGCLLKNPQRQVLVGKGINRPRYKIKMILGNSWMQ